MVYKTTADRSGFIPMLYKPCDGLRLMKPERPGSKVVLLSDGQCKLILICQYQYFQDTRVTDGRALM